jgi:hypothetical protein
VNPDSNGLSLGLRIGVRDAGPLVSKPKVEAIGVDPSNQEMWASIAGNLVHFDQDGKIAGYYCLSAANQPVVKPSTLVVQPDRILIGSDPQGVFVYARPDKPLAPAAPSAPSTPTPPASQR